MCGNVIILYVIFFRPYFTYWVTFVQIVVFIVSLAVYGIAPIGISTTVKAANVRPPVINCYLSSAI